MFVIEDTNNNKFGGYITASLQPTGSNTTDHNSFLFSLKSNGRVSGMHKFEIQSSNSQYAFYLDTKSSGALFRFGGGHDMMIYKQNSKSSSFCYQHNSYYDFHGITKAFHPDLTEGNWKNFTPKRFIVIQMK